MSMAPAIDSVYRHTAKRATVGAPLMLGDSHLKWYDLAPADAPIDPALIARARAFVIDTVSAPSLALDRDCGFVILHRCGEDFYFLLVSVWRGSNELWEAVFYRDAATPGFARFDPAYPHDTALRPTFCVWELGIVAYEVAAWTRFLQSSREPGDFVTWHDAQFAGVV